MGLMVDSLQVAFQLRSTSRDTKIRPNKIEILCPSLRISGQLPAPIVNGGGDSF